VNPVPGQRRKAQTTLPAHLLRRQIAGNAVRGSRVDFEPLNPLEVHKTQGRLPAWAAPRKPTPSFQSMAALFFYGIVSHIILHRELRSGRRPRRPFNIKSFAEVHISVKSHSENGPCRTVRGEKNAVVGIVL
jgi:hypothetical protein